MDVGILALVAQQYPITKQFTDNKLCARAWLWRTGDVNLLP
ncbi:TPA: P22AR C-terminal domain-containing protein, partial [Salmonella enterica]